MKLFNRKAWAMLALLCFAIPSIAQSKAIRLEAEDAEQFGTMVVHDRPGFSGSGYVTGFISAHAHILWQFKAHAGIYGLRVGYSVPGEKGIDFKIDGEIISGMLPGSGNGFGVSSIGKIELREGSNTLELDRGWGYFDIDYVDLIPSPKAAKVVPPGPTLSDPEATLEAKRLYRFLLRSYGNTTLSGQYDEEDSTYIRKSAGVLPAIRGSDLMDYSPSRVERGATSHEAEDMISAGNAGQIVTLSWHWNAPTDLIDKMEKDSSGHELDHLWYRGFYTEATTFDVAKALSDPESANYQLLLRDIDAIAVPLKKLSDNHIPVLWRPLHEAEGGWFWWGAKGPEPFIQLWKLMYLRLTAYHHLHNLIWVYSSGTKPEWYPGDQYVDVVGIDAYPSSQEDPLTGTWDQLETRFNRRKILAISEFGGIPDVAHMKKFGVTWSYFVSWSDTARNQPSETVKALYLQPEVTNEPRLPKGVSTGGKR